MVAVAGDFKGGDLHGYGQYKFTDGSVYEGQFEHGWMHGQGLYKVKEGHVFEGQYREGKREGQGAISYANGEAHDTMCGMGGRPGREQNQAMPKTTSTASLPSSCPILPGRLSSQLLCRRVFG